jgi:hypothetical protein
LIESQPALNEYRAALAQILIDYFCPFAECPAIDKADFVVLATVLAVPAVISCDSEINYWCLVWQIRQLRIPGQVTHQQYFVK